MELEIGEISVEINGVIHVIPRQWSRTMSGKELKEMDIPKYHKMLAYYKLPDIPGNDQEWHPLKDDESITLELGMKVRMSSY